MYIIVKQKFDPELVSTNGSLTKSDVIAFNSRSSINLVFTSKNLKNMSDEHFVKLTCVYLGLPLTLDRGNSQRVEGFDYPVESCLTLHGNSAANFLDANVDHHSGSCPSTGLAVSRRHSNLTSTLAKFATEAGAIVTREHSSYNLLNGLLSKAQCAKLFPKPFQPATSVYPRRFWNY